MPTLKHMGIGASLPGGEFECTQVNSGPNDHGPFESQDYPLYVQYLQKLHGGEVCLSCFVINEGPICQV